MSLLYERNMKQEVIGKINDKSRLDVLDYCKIIAIGEASPWEFVTQSSGS